MSRQGSRRSRFRHPRLRVEPSSRQEPIHSALAAAARPGLRLRLPFCLSSSVRSEMHQADLPAHKQGAPFCPVQPPLKAEALMVVLQQPLHLRAEPARASGAESEARRRAPEPGRKRAGAVRSDTWRAGAGGQTRRVLGWGRDLTGASAAARPAPGREPALQKYLCEVCTESNLLAFLLVRRFRLVQPSRLAASDSIAEGRELYLFPLF